MYPRGSIRLLSLVLFWVLSFGVWGSSLRFVSELGFHVSLGDCR